MRTSPSPAPPASARQAKKPFVVPFVEKHERLTELTFAASVASQACSPSSMLTADGLCRQP